MRRIGITCIYIRFVDTFVVSFGQLPIATTKPCGKEVCLKDANTSKLWREATKPPCLPFLHSTCLFQTAFEFLYRDIEIRCRGARERDIYICIHTVSFRGKGSRKVVLSSNLRTLDTQNKVRLISQPPQEIFFLLDLGDILLRGYDCLSIETRFYIPLLFVPTKSTMSFFFHFKEKSRLFFFFSSFIVSSKSLRLTRTPSILYLDASELRQSILIISIILIRYRFRCDNRYSCR